MKESALEKRVAALEEEMAALRRKFETDASVPWWERIAGTFAHDPIYEAAMKLGRQYRESLRPKKRSSKTK